jgi:WhiB family redox-sensing transcriptional regulator
MSAWSNAQSALGGLYAKAPTAEEIHWQLQGLCRQDDPRKWTPDPPSVEYKSQEAKKICHRCPVMQQCREWALKHREQYGVWGGLTEAERDMILTHRRHKRREQFSDLSFYATGS